MNGMLWLVVGSGAVCALVCRALAVRKGQSAGAALVAGFFLGIFGVAIYLFAADSRPKCAACGERLNVGFRTCPVCRHQNATIHPKSGKRSTIVGGLVLAAFVGGIIAWGYKSGAFGW